VRRVWGVAVKVGGNQTMVGEGSGVPVGGTGVGVASRTSSAVQELIPSRHAAAPIGITAFHRRAGNPARSDLNDLIKR
jgi:hypothetical protein